EGERDSADSPRLWPGSRREARRCRARSVRAPPAPGRRPACGALRPLRGAAARRRVDGDVLGPPSALALERRPHGLASSRSSPELRGEADRQPRATPNHRAPRPHRAPRIKETARGSPRGLFEGSSSRLVFFVVRVRGLDLGLAISLVAVLRLGRRFDLGLLRLLRLFASLLRRDTVSLGLLNFL